MLDDFLKQTISIKSYVSKDKYNKPTYSNTTITGRIEFNRSIRLNMVGEQVITTALLFTKTKLKPLDLITYDSNDFKVISVESILDKNCNTIFYEISF